MTWDPLHHCWDHSSKIDASRLTFDLYDDLCKAKQTWPLSSHFLALSSYVLCLLSTSLSPALVIPPPYLKRISLRNQVEIPFQNKKRSFTIDWEMGSCISTISPSRRSKTSERKPPGNKPLLISKGGSTHTRVRRSNSSTAVLPAEDGVEYMALMDSSHPSSENSDSNIFVGVSEHSDGEGHAVPGGRIWERWQRGWAELVREMMGKCEAGSVRDSQVWVSVSRV